MKMATRQKPKIRPPRRNPLNVSANLNFEDTWRELEKALIEMHTHNVSNCSFEQIHRYAYHLVLRKNGELLYNQLQSFTSNWLAQVVRLELAKFVTPALLSSLKPRDSSTPINEKRIAGEKFLRAINAAFNDHQIVQNMASAVFMYLNKVYCGEQKRPMTYNAGMMHFNSDILSKPLIPSSTRPVGSATPSPGPPNTLDILCRTMLNQIAMDRDGDIIDKSLLKGCVNMLDSLHQDWVSDRTLYYTAFEEPFLDATREFYRLEGEIRIYNADAATYCRHTFRRLTEEEDRCDSTLSPSTKPQLTLVLEDELIRNKIKQLITMDSGVKFMVENDRFKDLKMLFFLNSRIDSTKADLTAEIQKLVQSVGNSINETAQSVSIAPPQQPSAPPGDKQKEKPDSDGKPTINQQTAAAFQWVEAVLALKEKYDNLWIVSFDSDKTIQTALTKSFAESINAFPRSSEFISLFIDENMKKGLKDKTESEVDNVLERAIVLLRYIQDKDLFERYYKKHLCKRLLMNKSVSIDVEKQMISRMKIELGNSFTSKLEAMFRDLALSAELTDGYKNRVAGSADSKRAELSIQVLTSMTWPLETMHSSSGEQQAKRKCTFPPSIERIKQGFEAYYAEKHSGRMLTWMANMGTADVRAVFPAVPGKEGRLGRERKHELNMSTYAMVVLLLFNDVSANESLSFEDIQARTNIETNDLSRTLQSLAVAPKTRVLIKEPMSRDIKPTDRFSFNESYQSNFLRVKIGAIASANKIEGERERIETEKKNNDSRGFAIEAAIVRIMKQRKQLTHQQLVVETVTQLTAKFKPDINMIKRLIESLIDREYLERIEDSTPPAYRYLA